MTGQPPVRPGEISDLIARAARLSRTRPGVGPAEAAAYLAAKANLLERIAAERAAGGGWTSRDITAAREAAAGARATADAAAARLAGRHDHPGGLT